MKRSLSCPVVFALLLAACTNTTSSTDPLKSGVQVSFSTRALPAGPSSGALAAPPAISGITVSGDTLRDGTNTLILDQAELVVRKVELERSGSNDCDSGLNGCEEIEAGPQLVDLPLAPGAQPQFTVDAPTGSYHQITFEIHKISSSDPAEQAFRQAHPEVTDQSILVQGRFNGQSFTFLSDVNATQELELSPPLAVVAGGAAVNVTVKVDVSTWFRAPSGGLLNPATANKGGPNEHPVSDNIRRSMRAFEDRDHDGDEGDG